MRIVAKVNFINFREIRFLKHYNNFPHKYITDY